MKNSGEGNEHGKRIALTGGIGFAGEDQQRRCAQLVQHVEHGGDVCCTRVHGYFRIGRWR